MPGLQVLQRQPPFEGQRHVGCGQEHLAPRAGRTLVHPQAPPPRHPPPPTHPLPHPPPSQPTLQHIVPLGLPGCAQQRPRRLPKVQAQGAERKVAPVGANCRGGRRGSSWEPEAAAARRSGGGCTSRGWGLLLRACIGSAAPAGCRHLPLPRRCAAEQGGPSTTRRRTHLRAPCRWP